MGAFDTLVTHNDAAHRSLERLFGRLAVVAREGTAPLAVLDAGVEAALTLLTAHHTYEDELLAPRLRAAGAEWVDAMEADHRAIEALASELAATRSGRADALAALVAALGPHLVMEESHLTADGWRALFGGDEAAAAAFGKEVAAHSRARMKPASRLLPLMLYNLDDDERRRFTERMPAPLVRGVVPFLFRPSWRALRPFMVFPPPSLRPWAP